MAATRILLGPGTQALEELDQFGRKYAANDVLISREDRTASGRLVRDVIATKKEFSLRYKEITGTSLTVYLDLYALNLELTFRVYVTTVIFDDFIVLMDPIGRSRLIARADGLWEGVNIILREV